MWLLVFLVVIVVATFKIINRRRIIKNLPPGPTPWPVLGNLAQLDPSAPHKTIAQWAKIYGPVFTIWIPKPNVIIADFKLMKDTFVKQGDLYSGRYQGFVFQAHITPEVPNGIILSDGPRWKEQRRFALHVLRDFGFGRNVMEAKIMKEADKLVGYIEEELNSGVDTLDLERNFHLCVGNIINRVLIGKAFSSHDNEFDRLKNIIENQLKNVQSLQMLLLDSYPWLRFIPLWNGFGYWRYLENGKQIEHFFKTQISEHKAELELHEDERPTDFCHAYLQEIERRKSDDSPSWYSEGQLCSIMGDLWAAGMETTVTTLRWAILYMILHPEIQEEVYEEIERVVGARATEMADKPHLPYTTATVNEIQRKANILPLNLQHRMLGSGKIGEYNLDADTVVVAQISAVHMDPTVFPNPDAFVPERFLENGRFKAIEQLAPFSLGKRQCLGESLARMELFLIFTQLIHRFRFSIPERSPKPSQQPIVGITLVPRPYSVTIEHRTTTMS